MKVLVLDTHAWVWWLSKPEKLSRRQRSSIDAVRKRTDGMLLLSAISGWEVALLAQNGRIRLPMQIEAWLEQATSIPGLSMVPLTVPIIAAAARLTALRDPADMLIVATALHYAAPLLTSDGRIEDAGIVQVVG